MKKAAYWLHEALGYLLRGVLRVLVVLAFRPKRCFVSEKARAEAFREPMVIISNHVRGMDAAVIYSMLRCPATALSAQDLVAQYPILRLLYKVFPMLRIDREHASLSWLRESRQLLRSGQHVMIAPEGKCSPERELLPFKPGCVMLAAASGTKILPIYHNGEYHYLFGKRFRMIVGEPIAVTPAPDARTSRRITSASFMELTLMARYPALPSAVCSSISASRRDL